MDGGQSAQNSEIFADLDQLSAELNRAEVLSSALVRATDEVSAKALAQSLNDDQRLNVNAVNEKQYYAQQAVSAQPIEMLGIFVSVIMAIGSSFAAMNTMYAAVSRRAREIGTLRVLGFSKASILFSFFVESVLLAGLGGLLGCLLVLPLNNITTGIGANFAELAFNFQRDAADRRDRNRFRGRSRRAGRAVSRTHGGAKRDPDGIARDLIWIPNSNSYASTGKSARPNPRRGLPGGSSPACCCSCCSGWRGSSTRN